MYVIYLENACNFLLEGFLEMCFLEDRITYSPILHYIQQFLDWVSL